MPLFLGAKSLTDGSIAGIVDIAPEISMHLMLVRMLVRCQHDDRKSPVSLSHLDILVFLNHLEPALTIMIPEHSRYWTVPPS
jgi:hypothetical protein